jgi:hypothetical protein
MRKTYRLPRLRWTSVALFLVPAVIAASVYIFLADDTPEVYPLEMTLALDQTAPRPIVNIIKPSVVMSPPPPTPPPPVLIVPHRPVFVTQQIFNAGPLMR